MEPGYITNQATNIDIHPMDFWTGDTDPSFIARTQVNGSSTGSSGSSAVLAILKSVSVSGAKMHHQLYKAFSKYLRKSPGGNKTPIFWDLVS
jgi:hypothetical protein